MATDIVIEGVLARVTTKLNEVRLDSWDRDRVQQLVTEVLGDSKPLEVDDGGGLHDPAGYRVGAIRRTPSGEWITERQNEAAQNSDAEIPAAERTGTVRQAVRKLGPKPG